MFVTCEKSKANKKEMPKKRQSKGKSKRTQERRMGVKGHKGVLNECIYLRIDPLSFIHNDSYCIQFIDNKCLCCFSLNFDIIFHLHCVLGAITTELKEHKVLVPYRFFFCQYWMQCSIQILAFWVHWRTFVGLKWKRWRVFILFVYYTKEKTNYEDKSDGETICGNNGKCFPMKSKNNIQKNDLSMHLSCSYNFCDISKKMKWTFRKTEE